MVVLTLIAAAVVDATIAAVLATVGGVFRTADHVEKDARLALASFRAWWFGLAFTVFANALKEAIAGFGQETNAVAIAILDATSFGFIAATCVAVAGLLFYLTYLFTGRRGAFVPIVVFYALYTALALYLVAQMRPSGIVAGKWFVQWGYANPAAGGPILILLTLLLLLPQIAAGIAYLVLRRRLGDPVARYRTGLVGWALVLWLGISLLAPFIQLGRFEAWQAGGRLVALAAALAILAAYRPPASIRARLHAKAWEPADVVGAEVEHRRERERAMTAAIRERIHELV